MFWSGGPSSGSYFTIYKIHEAEGHCIMLSVIANMTIHVCVCACTCMHVYAYKYNLYADIWEYGLKVHCWIQHYEVSLSCFFL
jgi:hypothetical protein